MTATSTKIAKAKSQEVEVKESKFNSFKSTAKKEIEKALSLTKQGIFLF